MRRPYKHYYKNLFCGPTDPKPTGKPVSEPAECETMASPKPAADAWALHAFIFVWPATVEGMA